MKWLVTITQKIGEDSQKITGVFKTYADATKFVLLALSNVNSSEASIETVGDENVENLESEEI